MYLQNKGLKLNINVLVTVGVGVLFFIIGIALPHIKRNFFAGIRTPWTLSDDFVWKKTHEIGGKLFIIAAFVMLIALVFPRYLVWIILITVLIAAVYPIFYSYFLYAARHRDEN